MYYLGFVGSGKVSKLALASEEGEILSTVYTPPLNLYINTNIRGELYESLEYIASTCKLDYKSMVANLKGACISMSGMVTDNQIDLVKKILNDIEFRVDFAPVLCEDVYTCFAANFIESGAIIIAGTGSLVLIKDLSNKEPIRVDGWGSIAGDVGGGYDLGRKSIRTLFRYIDGINIEYSYEKLKDYLLKYIGVSEPVDILQWIYNVRVTSNWRYSISDLAIPLIQCAEDEKDELSMEIVETGANRLFNSFKAACNRSEKSGFKLQDKNVLILEGGLFENSKIYLEVFKKRISELNSFSQGWELTSPTYTSLVGALALAISHDKYVNQDPILENIKKSAEMRGLVCKDIFRRM